MADLVLKDRAGNTVTFNGVDKITLKNTLGSDEEFVQPSGSLSITENGTYDVTDKSSAVVSVSGGGALETITVTVNSNTNEGYPSLGFAYIDSTGAFVEDTINEGSSKQYTVAKNTICMAGFFNAGINEYLVATPSTVWTAPNGTSRQLGAFSSSSDFTINSGYPG